MKWLPFLTYLLASPVVAGSIIIAVLSTHGYTTSMIVGGALAGFILALPVAWIVAGQLRKGMRI